MSANNAIEDDVAKLAELIKEVRVAMLTTVEDDGTLHSRPMATQDVAFNGDLWFFTRADSGKVHEVQEDRKVNVSYANPEHNTYVSVTGTAQLIRDRAKIEQYWKPLYKAWFPEGLDDPQLALLQVNVESAEYWQSPSGTVVKLAGLVKALATGTPYSPGENRKLQIEDTVIRAS